MKWPHPLPCKIDVVLFPSQTIKSRAGREAVEEASLPRRDLSATFLGADQGRVRPRAAVHLTGEEGLLGP